MALQPIEIPNSIHRMNIDGSSERIIDTANERIEAFMLADQEVIENFVTCDFHLLDQALSWIDEQHLITGNRFCELGSGFGVAAILAGLRDMESVGIEIEPQLVEQASNLADELKIKANFFAGSFVPRYTNSDLIDLASEMKHVDTSEGDVYTEIGLSIEDFDLFFAFPWPGEHTFFETIVDSYAANGALLLTYRGREGMNLVRKVE